MTTVNFTVDSLGTDIAIAVCHKWLYHQ